MLNRSPSFCRFLADRSGATAIEYGLIIGLVGLGMLVGLGDTHDGVSAMFNNLMEKVSEVLQREG